MYANKATIAVSPQECFIKFSCLGPKFDEAGEVISSGDIDTCEIIMNRDMLLKLRDLLTDVLRQEAEQKGQSDE